MEKNSFWNADLMWMMKVEIREEGMSQIHTTKIFISDVPVTSNLLQTFTELFFSLWKKKEKEKEKSYQHVCNTLECQILLAREML